MLKENYLLGIDLGTTNIKGNIMDDEGDIISTASRPNHLLFPGPEQIEQDPREWWDNTVSILREMTAAAGREVVKRIRGICISSHMISLLPLAKDGEPLRNAIIYQDSRSAAEVEDISGALGTERFMSIIGARPSVAFLPNKILWFKKNEPELFAKTCRILQANGYLNYKLTGKMEMDLDSAARCQCLDVNTLRWSDEIGHVIGVDLNSILPQPKAVNEIIGTVTAEAAAETGLISGIPVVTGASDAMASMYATGICRLGDAGESSGTTSLLFISSPVRSRPDAPATTQPCAIRGLPYVFDGPIGASGASIKWYLDHLGKIEKEEAEKLGINPYEYLNRIALDVKPGADGLLFFPYLVAGERAPLWNSHARGMFIGITLATRRRHFARAIFEGTAFAVRHVMTGVKEAGGQANSLRITGGGSNSRTWSMIKASMLRMPVLLLDEKSGDVPFGDVLIAGNAVGVFPDLGKAVQELIKVREVIEPNEEWADVYDKLYPFYIDMYQHLDQDLYRFKSVVDTL